MGTTLAVTRHFLAATSLLAGLVISAGCVTSVAMGQTPDNAGREQFLNLHPFLEEHEKPPGRFVPNEALNGALSWQGQIGWRTRNGPAIVIWSLGEPFQAENILYPNGMRGDANKTIDHGFRRHGSDGRLWVYGRIDIQPNDVSFIDGDQPIYRPPPQGDGPNLEVDLARDPAFLADLQDDRFAGAVQTVFSNRTFYRGEDPRASVFGERSAAALLAGLRGRGESYLDYYPSRLWLAGTYPDDRPEVERRLRLRIERISKELTEGPMVGVRLEDLGTLLGFGHHSAEEVRRAIVSLQPGVEQQRTAESEPFRLQKQGELEQARDRLAAFLQDKTNSDVFGVVRTHLTRLGWHVENDQDRQRVHQQWLQRALQVLQDVKQCELRPESAVGDWAKALPSPSGYGRSIERAQLEAMSADVRQVETGGLERRLYQLAATGRVTEQDYRSLTAQLSGPR